MIGCTFENGNHASLRHVVVDNLVLQGDRILLVKRAPALIEGGKTRIRPIIMTALATILALIPLALTANSGAIIASDLAVVVIGGLLTSTVLTLIVVPVIFELIGGWQDRRSHRQAAKEAGAPPHDTPPTASIDPVAQS